MELSHPFMNNPQPIDVPTNHIQTVEEIFKWIQEQPKFPKFTKNHAILFSHACYWEIEATKNALTQYVAIRASAPDLFDNRDPSLKNIQLILNVAQMISMPKTTKEGYQILIYRLIDTDPSKIMFADAIKGFCMFNDIRLSEDLLAEGYFVIFDMKGVRLGHVSRVQLGPLRSFMSYIQEAHPARLKKIYICHAASFVNQVMSLVKPLIKSELMSLLHFTTKGPQTIIDKDLLPVEYEGTCGSCVELYEDQRKKMETIYKDWLIDSAKYKKIKSNKKDSKKKPFSPPYQSFSALEID